MFARVGWLLVCQPCMDLYRPLRDFKERLTVSGKLGSKRSVGAHVDALNP
jgi:hypothetical protein